MAAFRSLLKFHNLTIADLGISKTGTIMPYFTVLQNCWNYSEIKHTMLHISHIHTEFPQVILNIEKVELGISAGLQDRVIQTYGGVVHMDFSPTANTLSPYTPLDAALLPDLYLAYDMHAGNAYTVFCSAHLLSGFRCQYDRLPIIIVSFAFYILGLA